MQQKQNNRAHAVWHFALILCGEKITGKKSQRSLNGPRYLGHEFAISHVIEHVGQMPFK